MKGFRGLEGGDVTKIRHDGQWSTDPVSSAQFVTDCDWYAVNSPAKSRFEMKFGPGADNAGTRAEASADGVLNLDVHTLWPMKAQIMVAAAAEDHGVQKQLYYTVRADGKSIAEGKFGAWILGSAPLDLPIEGVKKLELETRIAGGNKPTIFWADAKIVTRDGKEIPLGELKTTTNNLLSPKEPGRDYMGGPIKIAGIEYAIATPGQPKDDKAPATVTIDLTGLDAVRLKTTLGGDYPLGNESQRRKTYAIRSQGTTARFLTLIEPYEDKSVVRKAEALGPDKLRVELTDGRVQEIELRNMEGDGTDISVVITESKDGKRTRQEFSK